MQRQAIGVPQGLTNWDPRESPQAIRRRSDAAKREREAQAAERDAALRRSVAETRRLSKIPMPQSRARLSVGAIYRDRAATAKSWERAFERGGAR